MGTSRHTMSNGYTRTVQGTRTPIKRVSNLMAVWLEVEAEMIEQGATAALKFHRMNKPE